MNKVLFSLCRHCVSIMDGWLPYPSTAIASSTGMSLYKVRKELKSLKEAGLVNSTIESFDPDYEGFNILLRGYAVTKKGMLTEEYKAAYQEEREICKDCFDIDIGELDVEDWRDGKP